MKSFGMYKSLFKEKSGQAVPLAIKPESKYSAYRALMERHEKIAREAQINSQKESN